MGGFIHHEEGPDGGNISQISRTNQFHHSAIVFAGVNLRADLTYDLVFFYCITDGYTFSQMHGHGFLQIDMQACLGRFDGLYGMPVGRCGYDHGIESIMLK